MAIQIQFKEKGKKRFYNFSHRKLKTIQEGMKIKSKAKKDFPTRVFRIRRKK